MDEIDRNIAVALQQDGSSGLAELAKVAGLSVSATAERVKRLEERGVIRAWRADLDPAAAGCPLPPHPPAPPSRAPGSPPPPPPPRRARGRRRAARGGRPAARPRSPARCSRTSWPPFRPARRTPPSARPSGGRR